MSEWIICFHRHSTVSLVPLVSSYSSLWIPKIQREKQPDKNGSRRKICCELRRCGEKWFVRGILEGSQDGVFFFSSMHTVPGVRWLGCEFISPHSVECGAFCLPVNFFADVSDVCWVDFGISCSHKHTKRRRRGRYRRRFRRHRHRFIIPYSILMAIWSTFSLLHSLYDRVDTITSSTHAVRWPQQSF